MSHGPTSRTLLAACGAALAAVALVPAGAAAATPRSGFEQYAGCPDREDVLACQTIDFSAGSIGLGALSVPIATAVHFGGGASNTDAGSFFVSDDGDVLSPVSFPLPGGLADLTGDAGSGETVTATPQLTTDPEFTANGTLLKLRIAFSGAGLPDGCGIGTTDEPVAIEITNGTTLPPEGVDPISGDPGSASLDVIKSIVTTSRVHFVDNAYAVPAASGCGDADAAINAHAALPAAPGASRTSFENATASAAFDLTKVFG